VKAAERLRKIKAKSIYRREAEDLPEHGYDTELFLAAAAKFP
jgi:hypothetical protein